MIGCPPSFPAYALPTGATKVMLTKFSVRNFKAFKERISLDFTKTKMYEFNRFCVVDGVVNKAIIYGRNGVGKSNLGYAIFDLISHLTDKNHSPACYAHYLHASKESPIADFEYEFRFSSGAVKYSYGKSDKETLVYEVFSINGTEMASIDRRVSGIASIFFQGAENLKTDIGDSKISLLSYIKKNSVLDVNEYSKALAEFFEFINSMLFFRSLDRNDYIGFEQGVAYIGQDIIERGNVDDFERFLNDAGIRCKVDQIDARGRKELAFNFDGNLVPFFEISSQGTSSLALFYFWFQRIKEERKVKFLFIDEFDAFYHQSLSMLIVKMLIDIKAQVVITTHNTSVMTNELMRPDCYFLMGEAQIKSLPESTEKELREAHNIEKMYKAGSFDV